MHARAESSGGSAPQPQLTPHVVAHGDVWHLGDVILVCCTTDELDWYRPYGVLVDGQMMAMGPERAGKLAWLIAHWERRTGQTATLIDCRYGSDHGAPAEQPDTAPNVESVDDAAYATVATDDGPAPEPGTTGPLSPWIKNPHDVQPGDVWRIGSHRVHVGPTRHHVLAALPLIEGLEALYQSTAVRVCRMALIKGLAEDSNPARQD